MSPKRRTKQAAREAQDRVFAEADAAEAEEERELEEEEEAAETEGMIAPPAEPGNELSRTRLRPQRKTKRMQTRNRKILCILLRTPNTRWKLRRESNPTEGGSPIPAESPSHSNNSHGRPAFATIPAHGCRIPRAVVAEIAADAMTEDAARNTGTVTEATATTARSQSGRS